MEALATTSVYFEVFNLEGKDNKESVLVPISPTASILCRYYLSNTPRPVDYMEMINLIYDV